MRHRAGDAGVTLIEMLVVLVVIGIMASTVAMSFRPKTSGTAPEVTALKLVADLRLAVQFAIDHQRGFGVKAGPEGYRFWTIGAGGWEPHADPSLRRLKPFPDTMRISVQDHEDMVFAVSRYLVPAGSTPWQVTLRQGPFAHQVTFDGVTAQWVQTGGD
ncbi:Tfp pilus assembly protein FimT/FimU [uncultured Roseobacter sp.]|uniref:pilus assembly FimT family protein n=1 Tax=uncultured Roseobacter sp. TaxID=114847 RepID=UPI00262975A6|nr:prepilin-type N-terminal cleavage/methylation domain-containing protein [uncultured Roseobacter sp.]